MKINEVLVEGPLDYLKGLVNTGTRAGAQAASQQAAGQKELQGLVKNIIGKWNTYYGQTGDQNIVAWANKFFGRDVSKVNPPATTNANDVKQYITTLVKAYKSGQLDSPSKSAEVTPVSQQQTLTAPSASSSIGATGKRGAVAPAQSQAYQSQMGVTVKQANDSGIVLSYRNRNYMLNNDGQWALEGKTAVSGQLDAEMNKVAMSTGYM